MIIFPKAIDKNLKIGVTATSCGLDNEADLNKLESAKKNFEEMGYCIVETANVRKNLKLVSSSAKERANEFMELWENDEVDYIVAARGGEFLMDMLPYLHQRLQGTIRAKWVQGFSDTSLLLFYLTTNYHIASVHASNFSTYGMRVLDESLLNTVKFLESGEEFQQESFEKYEGVKLAREVGMELEPFNLTEKVEYKLLNKEGEVHFEGRLLGGCMDVLRSLLGTPYDKTVSFCSQFDEGMIWYLENCEMSVPDIYRTLWSMREAGWFQNAKGFLIGRTSSRETVYDFTYEDALRSALGELNVPIVYDVDFGHVAPQWTLINGAKAEFHFSENEKSITQKFE